MKRLLIIHSSAELYGSDRSLLDFISRQRMGVDITVLVPEHGPLCAHLESCGVHVVIGEVCKLQRQMLGVSGLLTMIANAVRSLREIKRIEGSQRFDLIYSNTVAVFGGALYALFTRRPHVWHVREIIDGSPILTAVFRLIVPSLSSIVICNSNQTREWIDSTRGSESCRVVWNGVPVASPPGRRTAERAQRGWNDRDTVITLAGRINAWKGQLLLLEAFELLRSSGIERARLWIVGSAFAGQETCEETLVARIAASPFRSDILIEQFRPDVEMVWEASDIVTVPSTEPEPFGRVAIEAMSFGRPVIAAAHGGLLDIVEDGVCGLLFKPRNVDALKEAMQRLVQVPELRSSFGRAAQERQRNLFSVDAYVNGVTDALQSALLSSNKARNI